MAGGSDCWLRTLVINKTIFNSNGSVQDFGIGDTAFQAALIHDIDRHWALVSVLV